MNNLNFTDDQLEHYASDPKGLMTTLECQLAQCVIDDREVFRQLIKNIEPMAAQVINPSSNVFSRQLDLIRQRL